MPDEIDGRGITFEHRGRNDEEIFNNAIEGFNNGREPAGSRADKPSNSADLVVTVVSGALSGVFVGAIIIATIIIAVAGIFPAGCGGEAWVGVLIILVVLVGILGLG